MTRVFWFVSCAAGVVGLQIAVLSPGTLQRPSLLLSNWWWLASLAAAAAFVEPRWGAGVAGLGLGGVVAVALDRHLVVTGGMYWSPGFVAVFAGGIVTAALIAMRVVRIWPEALAEARDRIPARTQAGP